MNPAHLEEPLFPGRQDQAFVIVVLWIVLPLSEGRSWTNARYSAQPGQCPLQPY